MTGQPAETVWDAIDDLLETYDGDIRLTCESKCAWSGQIRLTLTDPEGAPSRSIAFHAVGGAVPEHVAERLLADVRDWLATSGVEPLPAPPWAVD
jgi:type IV pilus biogenesis protein CpaD/CtpE